jgi:hypothetical protein
MTTFEVVLVARVPQSATSPTLTVIDRLIVDNFSYTEELNRPGAANLGCPIRSMSSSVTGRLVDLAATPSEVWIYADSTLAWAGEIQTLQIQGQTATLNCTGLLGYTFRMGVTSDLIYSATDQFTIAKGMVDQFQALTYGNYGIDTSTVGTSGVVRDRTYLRNELHNIGQRLSELGAVSDGFDIKVDPVTRKLVLTYPVSGSDLSASIFIDDRNIDSGSIAASVGPDDLVSDVAATGTSSTSGGVNSVLYSSRTTSSVQTSYGRSWNGQNFSGISVQATLDGAGDAYLSPRSHQLFQPGVTIVPRVGIDVGSFHVGDTVTYSYDAGLGLQTSTLRVGKLTVSVGTDGKQRLGVEFI